MTHLELIELFNSKQIKKGRLYSATLVSKDKDTGYHKTYTIRVRFCNYHKTKKYLASGKTPSANGNPNVQVLIPNVLTYNSHTKNYLVSLQTIGNSKPHTIAYYDNNNKEISKSDYQKVVKPNSKPIDNFFYKFVEDVIQIG